MQQAVYAPAAEIRKCSKCGTLREWDGGKGWHWRQCPECWREYMRQYRAANPDAINERDRQRYAANAEALREYHRQYRAANPEVGRESSRRWRAANPDAERERARRWRASNLDKVRERDRQRYAAHPEVRRKHNRNRRARKANAVCEHGPGCFAKAAQSMPQRCAVPGCLKRKDIQADHIIPLAGGGLDCKDNLQPLCRQHNNAKHAADPIAWAQRNGRLL